MYEFLFKYPQQAFADSEFVLASGWPLWLLFTLGAVGLALIAGFLIWKRASMKWWQLGMLGLVQAAMLALVLFVIWQPALVNERLLPGENAVAVMLDTSASMALNDGGSTRMVQAQQLLTPEALAELGETYTILPYGFADGAEALPGFTQLPEPGTATVLGQSILQTLRQASSSSLGAVIVVSDGADNNGAIAQNELSEIVGFGVPIHTVGIGREAIPEDLEMEEVVLPNKALAGTTLSARVNIRHDAGGTARVKVYNGDEFLSTHDVELDPEQTSTMALIDIEVPEPGQLDLRFTLDPINGERNLANNTRARVVDVPEGRYKILYVEGEPRWEYKFMQRALTDDPSIQLSTLLKVTPNKYYRQGIDSPEQLADGFPTERSELFAYDALIIGSMQVAEFTQPQQEMIRDFVSERGGSLMMLAGLNGLGLGGWGESVVNEVLPSRLSLQDAAFTRQKAPVVLTDAGRAAPMLKFSDSDAENTKQWSELPEVADYQKLGPLRPAATTLLEVNVDGRNQPLLVSQPYGRGQSFILATGGTWRWQMSLPLDDLRHETFWRQLARNLVANSPRPFELTATVENDNILVRAELRDPDAEENQGLAITAVASSDTNEVVNLELLPVPGRPGVYEAAFNPASNGLYSVEALSRKDDDVVSSVRTATRYDQGQESFGVRQNRALLERLAAVTGGRYWTPAEWG
ncbi:MAG: hypothetical protein SV422_11420, partial [Pseudomonadota bacterium]|nr:hypothetical protein [Pseudomonadota bacterium]